MGDLFRLVGRASARAYLTMSACRSGIAVKEVHFWLLAMHLEDFADLDCCRVVAPLVCKTRVKTRSPDRRDARKTALRTVPSGIAPFGFG